MLAGGALADSLSRPQNMLAEIILSTALGATAAWAALAGRMHRRQVSELVRARVRIQTEEQRVFDFLHGIGEALKDDSHVGDLDGLIVEGALRILEADGGALYLTKKKGTVLQPSYVSKGSPPFVELPKQDGPATTSLHAQIRLQAEKLGEGLIGRVLSENAPLSLLPSDAQLTRLLAFGVNSIFIAPLVYAGQNLGVLALARMGKSEPFGPEHFSTFKALAEQSAFSLFDAFLHHEATEKRQIEKDLRIATEVQRILLPHEPPVVEGFDLAGTNLPARWVSGDYFDYIPLDADRWGVVIADVSGKGIPAALMMAMTRTALRLLATGGLPPAEVIHQLNAQLYPDIREDMFISLAYVVIDQRSEEVKLIRAGHDAPLVYRAADKSVTRVNPPGMAVGIDSGGAFNRVTNEFSLVLEPGDCLILYTDGVTEAHNRNGDEFGLEAMIRSVQASASEGAAGIVQRVTSDVKVFIGDQPPHDDITLITILKK
jgi:sigma-B regulation protein RsbU (phosphoserine phosphatase)